MAGGDILQPYILHMSREGEGYLHITPGKDVGMLLTYIVVCVYKWLNMNVWFLVAFNIALGKGEFCIYFIALFVHVSI